MGGIWPIKVWQGLGAREMPLGSPCWESLPPRDEPYNSIVQNRVYSSHGRVKRVVEAERERDRQRDRQRDRGVEARPAMSTWRRRGKGRERDGIGGRARLQEA